MKKFTFVLLLFTLLSVSCNNDDLEDLIRIPPLGDNSSILKESRLRVISASASSTNPEFPITNSYDGNVETFYESSAITTGGDYFPITLTYSFTGEQDLDYIKYTPKQSSARGSITSFSLEVIREGNFAYTHLGEFTLDGLAETSFIELERVNKVKSVRFIIHSATDNVITCSEMLFYNNAKESFDPLTIFTDELCEEIKPGVDQAAIDTIPIQFYQTLANKIREGYSGYDKEFRVREYTPLMNPSTQAKKYKIVPYSSLDYPTGIYVEPNEDLVVFMGYTFGKRLRLVIQNLDDGYNVESFPLKNGTNLITSQRGGLAYVQYPSSDGTGNPIKIHIASGKINGYFDIAKHASEEWQPRLNAATYKYFDLVGRMTHINFPVESFKEYTPSGLALTEVTDSIVFYQHQLLGLYKYNTPISNRLYMHVHEEEDMYMYATSFRTAYHLSTLPEVANPELLKTTALWGPAHEIGHVNQTRPGFLWVGMTEVSNNLFSQYTQQRFQLETRLSTEVVGTYANRFEKAYNELLNQADSTHFLCSDVFCKLVPFWQLQLYFDNEGYSPDLYPDFFEGLRKKDEGADRPLSQGELQLDFVRRICDITKLDLLDYFKAWRMLTPILTIIEQDSYEYNVVVTPDMISALEKEIVLKGYPKPTHKIEYIQDHNADCYRNSSEIIAGQVATNGLTITTSGWQNVVAYEVFIADELVAVHTTSSFLIPTLTGCKVYAVSALGTKIVLDLGNV